MEYTEFTTLTQLFRDGASRDNFNYKVSVYDTNGLPKFTIVAEDGNGPRMVFRVDTDVHGNIHLDHINTTI